MKNRRKIISPKKPIIKQSDSNIERNRFEQRRNLTSISLTQNLEYLQQANNLFQKPFYNGGDADRYFKQSLRSYQHFDLSLIRPHSAKHLVKTSISLDSLKPKKKPLLIKSKRKEKVELRGSTPLILEAEKPTSEEVDVDIFYSPSSNTAKSPDNLTNRTASESSTILEGEEEEEEEDSTETADEDTEMAEDEDIPVEIPSSETEAEETDEEMEQVGAIIKQASDELVEVAAENQQLLGLGDEEAEEEGDDDVKAESPGGGDGSFFKFDPAIDAAVLRELEEAEKQAKATAKVIYELKTRVTELLKKDTHTAEEAKELEQKNKELKAQMLLFEEKTKRIQFLIAQTNLFENMIPPQTPLQTKHNEDVLPKVIVCGMTEHNIPKLILCDDKKKKSSPCPTSCTQVNKGPDNVNLPMSVVPKFAKRLSDSYTMQERLAAENADLEGMRYKLQSDLLNKDQTIEYLQRKLCSIQCEMRMLCKENSVLNEKIQQVCTQKQENAIATKQKRPQCGKGKGPCPADIENRLNEYSETTRHLEKQLCEMENDVKIMQSELTAVQAEREHLEQHKKVLICPPLCLPSPPCAPSPCGQPVCSPFPCSIPTCTELQLRDLKEQYCRLQDDYKSKVTEVGGLRADNEKLKTTMKDAEEAKKQAEDRAKEAERLLKALKAENNKFSGSKEQIVEQEQQLAVAKQRFREAQDELEELRAFIQDQQGQLDDYRNKYLEAQQEVEEQKRHIDMLEMDANRINEQVNLEIQRVKNQFQEKLQELLPLPDLLKTTQLKLQETQQMHLLAERNNEALNRDLQLYKDKVAEITNQLDKVRSDQQLGEDEKLNITTRLEQAEAKIAELQEENDMMRVELDKAQDAVDAAEREVQTKLHEIAQLSALLESVREESARQVARNKERCETVRRSMQNQISDLERQLAQSRAQARAAQKDRDEIRQKMQSQINNLHENFEDAQMRIRSLQGHVNFLKESYNTKIPGMGDTESNISDHHEPCTCASEF